MRHVGVSTNACSLPLSHPLMVCLEHRAARALLAKSTRAFHPGTLTCSTGALGIIAGHLSSSMVSPRSPEGAISRHRTAGRDQAQSDGREPPVGLLLWPGRLDGRLVQLSLPVHLPAGVQIQQEGPLQRGSHKRWGDNTAWGARSPGQLVSPQEQPQWHPNILAFPRTEKIRIFVPGRHPPGISV